MALELCLESRTRRPGRLHWENQRKAVVCEEGCFVAALQLGPQNAGKAGWEALHWLLEPCLWRKVLVKLHDCALLPAE